MSGSDRERFAIKAASVTTRKRPKLASRLGWATAFLTLLPLIVIMFGALLFPGGGRPWWAPGLVLSWLGAAGTGIGALVARARQLVARVVVSSEGAQITVAAIDEGGEVAPAKWRVPVADIVHGDVIPGFGARLERQNGDTIDVQVESTRDAEKLVAACKIAPAERRFTTAFKASWAGAAVASIGILVLLTLATKLAPGANQLTPIDAVIWLAAASAILGGGYFGTRAPKVEVGADGVKVSTLLGSRFVRFGELASIFIDGTTLTLVRHEGGPLKVPIAAGNKTQLRALRHRIEMGMAAHADAPQSPVRLALLDRKERPMAEWRDELSQAVNDDTGYRRQPLSRDDLAAILASPKTSTERRIGAALALQSLDGEAATPRIRIAAEACAEDQARLALLRIAEQEHEHHAIEEALEQAAGRVARAS